jgi:hypothetical protein
MCVGLLVQDQFFLSDFNETWTFSTDFRKLINMKFRENLSSGSRIVPRRQTYGRTGKRTDMTKLIVAFSNFAKAPKIPTNQARRSNSIKIFCVWYNHESNWVNKSVLNEADAKSEQSNICLTHFLLRNVGRKCADMCHLFSMFLYNAPLRRH